MKKLLILISFITTLIISCQFEPNIKVCPDQRFIGKWAHTKTNSMLYINTYEFDDENSFINTIEYKNIISSNIINTIVFQYIWTNVDGLLFYDLEYNPSGLVPFNILYLNETNISIDGNYYYKI